jgi:hypothetical protein
MIQIPLTPGQYQTALGHIMQVPQGNDLLSYELPTSEHPGQLVTAQVSLEFTYNGTDTLSVNVFAKRGLAKFASEGTIKAHLIDLLGQV